MWPPCLVLIEKLCLTVSIDISLSKNDDHFEFIGNLYSMCELPDLSFGPFSAWLFSFPYWLCKFLITSSGLSLK
jgi:hypothetical protein